MADSNGRRMPSRRVIGPELFLIVATLAMIGSVVAYWTGGGNQLFGGLVALGLASAGVGLIWWARTGMPDEVAVDERGEIASAQEDRTEVISEFTHGQTSVTRRRLLTFSFLAFAGGLGAAVLSMFRSFGPNPNETLTATSWKSGSRLVRADGTPIRAEDLRIGGVLTVYPEGNAGDPQAQTLLIHVRPDLLELPPDRRAWAPNGLVAYSKICTHAACPLGLYQEEQHLLLCPCHQSTFDVLTGARPTSGPATRPLPQLPLEVNPDGFVVALSDYPDPVGPGYWNMP